MNKFLNAFKHKFLFAFRGIWFTMREEKSLWPHILTSFVVIAFGVWVKLDSTQWILISMNIALVIAFEIMNTSIESLIDMIAYEYNLKVKKIKDIAAGGTLIVSIESLIVGLIIFIPKLTSLI